jgi:signal transduction histidine kinase
MYSHLSLEEMDADDPRRKNLEKVAAEATRCKNIVRGLLDFARQSESNVVEADANEILRCTLSLLQNQAQFQNITITTTLCASLPKAMMDSGFDLFLSDIDSSYLVRVGTSFGDDIVTAAGSIFCRVEQQDREAYKTRSIQRRELPDRDSASGFARNHGPGVRE